MKQIKAVIEIHDGMVEVISKTKGVKLVTKDFDITHTTEKERCLTKVYKENEEIKKHN